MYFGDTNNLVELTKIKSLVETEGVALVLPQNNSSETLEMWQDSDPIGEYSFP